MTNIRQATAKLLKDEFQINESVTAILFERGIIQEHDVKKTLIRNEYLKKVGPKGKRILKNKIAEKYCISVELVEKITKKDL